MNLPEINGYIHLGILATFSSNGQNLKQLNNKARMAIKFEIAAVVLLTKIQAES